MKTIFTFLSALLLTGISFGQAPQKMSYQAVIRNSSNALITSETIGMRLSILQGNSVGVVVYSENQMVSTNINGMASLEIGSGSVISGDFSAIDWGNGPYFIKTETDPTGGANYTISGTSELLSVPYALFSGNSSSGPSDSWSVNGSNIYTNKSGNVGLGISNPMTKLTIKTPFNTGGWRHFGVNGNDSVIVDEGIGGVSAAIGTSSNHAFRLNAGGQGRLSIYPSGDVVVGSNSTGPFGKFAVQTLNNSYGISHLGEGGNILATYMGGTSAGIGTFSNTNMRIFANGISSVFIAEATNNVGIGVDYPSYKMDIADRIRIRSGANGSTAGIWLNNPGNSAAITFMGVKDVDLAGFYGNVSGWGLVMNTNTGDVAVGNQNPVAGYKLSVNGNQYLNGLLVTTGDAEIGADAQVNGNLNVSGKIGIGGVSDVPLYVAGYTDRNFFVYTSINSAQGENGWEGLCSSCTAPISIMAAHTIAAGEFVAYSDIRIKDVISESNSANDLETINALKITDYTMKDKVKYGNKPYKKVIAQEVEKVYPQVVSKHTDFIPNVYQLTTKIEKTSSGYLLSFSKNHSISQTAKKLKVLLTNEKDMQQFEILSIPSENQVLINAIDLKSDQIFVYGEEVDDFRTIDYEGLSTLNISATQELSKLLNQQQAVIDRQQKQIELLEERLIKLETK